MTSGTTVILDELWSNSASNVFAVGRNGTILRYNGSSWSSMTSATGNSLYGLWGSSGSDVYAVGDNGTILHYNGSFHPLPGQENKNLHSKWEIEKEIHPPKMVQVMVDTRSDSKAQLNAIP